MGLFSNLRGAPAAAAPAKPQNAIDATARAVLTLPLVTAFADGSIDRAEMEQIINMCAFNPIFQAIGVDRTVELVKEIVLKMKADGSEAVFAAAQATLTPNTVETAMCFAVRTALADGTMDKREQDTLIAMGKRLGMTAETFVDIYNVMVMMQRAA